jgi:hypothetical protein
LSGVLGSPARARIRVPWRGGLEGVDDHDDGERGERATGEDHPRHHVTPGDGRVSAVLHHARVFAAGEYRRDAEDHREDDAGEYGDQAAHRDGVDGSFPRMTPAGGHSIPVMTPPPTSPRMDWREGQAAAQARARAVACWRARWRARSQASWFTIAANRRVVAR